MTKTPRTDEQCCEASAEELCKAALEHYDYVSTKALEWSNQIPQAIRFWYLEKPRLERELAAARQPITGPDIERVIDDYVSELENDGADGEDEPLSNERRKEFKEVITDLLTYPAWDELWGRIINGQVRQREGEIRASVIEECAMMCDAVGARLSHGAGYACKIAAEEIRNSV